MYTRFMSILSTFYKMARMFNDANAVSKGPSAIGKRLVRKQSFKSLSSILRKILK